MRVISRQTVVRACAWLAIAALAAGAAGPARGAQGVLKAGTIEGKLISLPGTGPALKTSTRTIQLTGRTTYLFHSLQDKRLAGRELRLEGQRQPDGSFEVERIFTMHDGKLYRIRYYCETCNIEALEPGNCVCCQQPTELQEYPASEGEDPNPADVRVLH